MDAVKTVQAVQEYISEHSADEDFSIENLCKSVGVSRRNGDRLFKALIGKTMKEYINAVCLTHSAEKLLYSDDAIINIALNNRFRTHEGFTRSFKEYLNLLDWLFVL